MEKLQFQSKIDWWMKVLLLFLVADSVFFMGMGVWKLLNEGEEALSLLVSGLFIIGLLLGLIWPMSYTLENTALVVRSGLLKFQVSYTDILGV